MCPGTAQQQTSPSLGISELAGTVETTSSGSAPQEGQAGQRDPAGRVISSPSTRLFAVPRGEAGRVQSPAPPARSPSAPPKPWLLRSPERCVCRRDPGSSSWRGRLCPELQWINRILIELNRIWIEVFPGSLAGKESACNAEDPGAIPGLGRFPGEGIGYSFQYS